MLGHTCTGTCICTMEEDKEGVEKLVWNPECLGVAWVAGQSRWVRSVDFSPDGNRVVIGAGVGLVKIWDTKTGALVSRFM